MTTVPVMHHKAARTADAAVDNHSAAYSATETSQMNTLAKRYCVFFAGLLLLVQTGTAQVPAPKWPVPDKSWVDAKTGHRVIRVSEDPHTAMLYFDENAFTPDGKDMI